MKMRNPVLVKNFILIVVAALLFFPSLEISAQPLVRPLGAKHTAHVLQDWEEELREIDQRLVAGNYKRSYREATLLIRTMSDRIISGPSVGQLLGFATVLRAIAAYHLGRKDEALWHWHVATQMFPQITNYEADAYGAAWQFFQNNKLPEEMPERKLKMPMSGDERYPQIEPPRKKRAPMPKIPAAKRGSGKVSIVVQAVIQPDGRLRQPRILDSQGELTMVCATLDVLRDWRFKPVLVDGEPIEAYYKLKVNFKT